MQHVKRNESVQAVRAILRMLHRVEALACAVRAIVLCVVQRWFSIPAVLFGLFAMVPSDNRVASFIGSWAWKLIGLELYALGR